MMCTRAHTTTVSQHTQENITKTRFFVRPPCGSSIPSKAVGCTSIVSPQIRTPPINDTSLSRKFRTVWVIVDSLSFHVSILTESGYPNMHYISGRRGTRYKRHRSFFQSSTIPGIIQNGPRIFPDRVHIFITHTGWFRLNAQNCVPD